MQDQLTARLIEKVDHRFYGKYRGIVSDNNDPDNRGRLKARVPGVLGDDVVTGWALPCAPYGGAAGQGFFFVPDVGAAVWVEFECGLLEFPIWVGTFWAKPGGSSEAPPPADSQSPPTSKIIKTTNHTIELADASGDEAIKITDNKNTNKVTLDKNGIKIEDNNGNSVTLSSSAITIEGSQIKVGANASQEGLVKGQTLVQLLTTLETALISHTHVGNLGAPTSPPTPPLIPSSWSTALSKKTVVE